MEGLARTQSTSIFRGTTRLHGRLRLHPFLWDAFRGRVEYPAVGRLDRRNPTGDNEDLWILSLSLFLSVPNAGVVSDSDVPAGAGRRFSRRPRRLAARA